ncbi:hypothetical protein SESBI_20840 [Sesbania bispinosa]|nr:hypothetical protein SESBI_20840 [Sesbania bispinosa]
MATTMSSGRRMHKTKSKAATKDKKSEEYEAWEDEVCLVKSWLMDSMTKEIRSLFIH